MFNTKMKEYVQLTDQAAFEFLSDKTNPVHEAMLYSFGAGGKRVRAALLLGVCEAFSGNVQDGAPIAAALEFIHTFSLIHDDLPCIDNDDLRRGKPSCHIVFGEAKALLAGDALSIAAFELIASAQIDITAQQRVRLIKEFAVLSGRNGMVLGQQRDIDFENSSTPPTKDELMEMYKLKTCCLLQVAARSGAIIAGKGEEEIKLVSDFAESLGLAFQLIDDILDETGSAQVLGKPIGSDRECGKSTSVTLFGLEKAREMSVEYTQKALELAGEIPGGEFLVELTKSLLNRDK